MLDEAVRRAAARIASRPGGELSTPVQVLKAREEVRQRSATRFGVRGRSDHCWRGLVHETWRPYCLPVGTTSSNGSGCWMGFAAPHEPQMTWLSDPPSAFGVLSEQTAHEFH